MTDKEIARREYKRNWMNNHYSNMSESDKEIKRAYQRAWYAANKEKAKETNKKCYLARREKDKEAENAKQRVKSLKHYYKDIERSREKCRQSARKRRETKGEHHKAVKFKYQYGITIQQRDAMFAAQGFACGICGSDKPGSIAGWNTDHCHKTGIVRFILCAHCNRGLGAFKDNPETLRRAANMLELFYSKQNQADPVINSASETVNHIVATSAAREGSLNEPA